MEHSPLLSTPFIHPIDLIFGTYNELPLYFQLSKTIWCLIGFNDNHNYINDVRSDRDFEFLNFQIILKFELIIENGEKTVFSDWNLLNC